jgi:predicted nucleic acid-binding protein
MGRDDVLTQAEAWHAYDRWSEDPRIVFLDEPLGLERAFRELSQQGRSSPKQWADAYLAAFALVSGTRLVTFDRAFRNKGRSPLILG